MARKCSKCGEIVEDDSLFCPECQNYTQKIVNDRKYPVKWIALALIIVIVLLSAGAYFSYHSSKTDTTLTMTSNSHLGSSNAYEVVLKDANGKALVNEFITVEFKNSTYTLQTNANGTASINLTAGDGSYEVKSYYKGSSTYNEAHSSDIIVK